MSSIKLTKISLGGNNRNRRRLIELQMAEIKEAIELQYEVETKKLKAEKDILYANDLNFRNKVKELLQTLIPNTELIIACTWGELNDKVRIYNCTYISGLDLFTVQVNNETGRRSIGLSCLQSIEIV